LDELRQARRQGVRIFAPPIFALLSVTDAGEIVPSEYAHDIRKAGLDIITWTFERSALSANMRETATPTEFSVEGRAWTSP